MLPPSLMSEVYNSTSNNCGHFVVKVWKELTGQDISSLVLEPLTRVVDKFQKLKQPESPCLVVMTFGQTTHVGVWYKEAILHMTEQGPRYQELNSIQENYRYRFYK